MTVQNIYDHIDRLVGTDSNSFSDADKLAWLGFKYTDLQFELTDVDDTRQLTETNVDLTTSNSYTIPSGYLSKIYMVELDYAGGGDYYRVTIKPKTDIDHNSTYSTIKPVGWLENNVLKINPVPSSTVTNGVRWSVINGLTALAASGDTIALPTGWDELLALTVAQEYADAQGDYPLADRYKEKVKEKIYKLRNQFFNRENQALNMTPYIDNYK